MRASAILALSLTFAACEVAPASAARGDSATVQPSAGAGQDIADAVENARTDLVCTEDEGTGEAQEPWAVGPILVGVCVLAGALMAEYDCNRHVLDDLCPPGATLTRTIRDTLDKTKTVVVPIPCDTLHLLICGTAAVGGGELLRRTCAGIL